jgi:hypothetical protein
VCAPLPTPQKNMPPKYRKKDYVKVLAIKFDNDERDKSGMNFSERWAADYGNGLWCYGTMSRVYVKKRGQPQKYSIKYDGGQSMARIEDQIEPANEEEDDEEANDGDKEPDRGSGNQSTDSEGQTFQPQEDKDVTDDDLGSVNEDDDQNCWMDGNCVQIGESVECGDGDDPKQWTWKTKRWQTTRIQLEILAVTLVDAFLACRKLIPIRWQHETDDESVFWKFVCHLIPQIDPRPGHERTREEETDPTAHCVQIRLGVKKTLSGKNKALRELFREGVPLVVFEKN